MGGFTSAPPILAAKRFGARTFLHESNTIPGRANRWLSRVVNQAFIGFPQTAARLHTRNSVHTGTPVRPQFQLLDPGECRAALGLDPDRPMLLVTGGSQGASGLNELIQNTLPLLAKALPQLQYFLLTGPNDADKVRQTAGAFSRSAIVHPFFAEMNWALGAATVAVSRAGASSLAELAAMRVPGILVPFPAATDNHQFFNANAYVETGAACLLEQRTATPEALAAQIVEWVTQVAAREKVRTALARWHAPRAAEQIAEAMVGAVEAERARRAKANAACNCCSCGHENHDHSRSRAA
jgi:UDP-N-acetylglucosamine--N-acetylmuramyl-(pentapeptide) pyrophosphoryl-undecaprenol N-acetylglucosamine transferase